MKTILILTISKSITYILIFFMIASCASPSSQPTTNPDIDVKSNVDQSSTSTSTPTKTLESTDVPHTSTSTTTPSKTLALTKTPVNNPTSTITPIVRDNEIQGTTFEVLDQIDQIVDVSAVQSGYEEVEVFAITYLSDGLKVKGYLAIPLEGENLPCIIYNHGGSGDSGAITDTMASGLPGTLASWGYVGIASQYRGVAGGEGREEFGGADVNDVLNLIPILESIPQADAARIGMYGWSRGGMMTYIALTKTDRISAAVVGAGLADLYQLNEDHPGVDQAVYSKFIPNYASEMESSLDSRSAIRWPEKINKDTPILILHGSADRRVSPTQSIRMVQALYESMHPVRFVLFEGGDHGLYEYTTEVYRLIKDWMDYYVRDQEAWPSLEPHGR